MTIRRAASPLDADRSRPTSPPAAGYSLILHPNRSLGARGFRWVAGVLAAAAALTGSIFLVMGAWPVFGFMGVEIALALLALALHRQASRRYERIDLTDRELLVTRVDARGRQQRLSLQPYWLRVVVEDRPRPGSRLLLVSHGRGLVIGAFLTPEERREVAESLGAALTAQRNRSFAPPSPAIC